jgi:phospholipid/cholesterol/gamma-HCH transport system substrate-binding protein
MKKESGSKWKVGMFTVIGAGVFLAGIFFIGNQRNLFSSVLRAHAVFANVVGLKVGSNVRFGGITVGTVENIHLITDTSVNVVMAIQSNITKFIKKDASASIGTDGLMGEKVIVISPGLVSRQNIMEGSLLASNEPVEMDSILASLKITVDHAAVFTDELSKIAYRINHGNGALSKLIGDTLFANNITKTMSNLKKSTKGLDENMEAVKHNFLLRGYFKKKKKEADNLKKEQVKDLQKKEDGK